eukprot:jgi/Chrpa1/14575/Chrysochromulina_OHIO_Genome00021918-RA
MGAAEMDLTTRFCADVQRQRRSKLRVLCLHGHGSNNDITQLQLIGLALREIHGVSCDVVEATIEASAQNSTLEMLSERPFRTWFRWWMLGTNIFATTSLDESLEQLMQVVERYGPYDGLYGFSQGAFMCSVLCNPAAWRGRFGLDKCPFRFVILANAGMSDTLPSITVAVAPPHLRATIELPNALPSLHLIGAQDWMRASQERHAGFYEAPTVYTHAKGHEIPMRLREDRELQRTLASFLKRFESTDATEIVVPQAVDETQEREDYEEAIRAQALRIQQLEADLAAANEQVEVQTLIGESRARQLEDSREREELLDLKLSKLRSATRLLWGVFQEMQMRVAEQQASVQAGNELLESLDGLLDGEIRLPTSAGTPRGSLER